MRQYGNSSAYEDGNGSESGSEVEDVHMPHSLRQRSPPYNPSGYVPSPADAQEARASSVAHKPSRHRPNPSQSSARTHAGSQRRSGHASPPQRSPSTGRTTSHSHGAPTLRNSSGSGRVLMSQGSGSGNDGSHFHMHSPIKQPQSYGQQQDPHQGPYEYHPPTRARASDSHISNGGVSSRQKLNMLSQPTASSRARFSSDTADLRKPAVRSSRRSVGASCAT